MKSDYKFRRMTNHEYETRIKYHQKYFSSCREEDKCFIPTYILAELMIGGGIELDEVKYFCEKYPEACLNGHAMEELLKNPARVEIIKYLQSEKKLGPSARSHLNNILAYDPSFLD